MKIIAILLALISFSVFAGDPYQEFPAKYAVFTDDNDENPEISFRIMGEAGKRMYEEIEQEPSLDSCEENGNFIKKLGNIECHFNPSKENHICYFGFKLTTGEFDSGISC